MPGFHSGGFFGSEIAIEVRDFSWHCIRRGIFGWFRSRSGRRRQSVTSVDEFLSPFVVNFAAFGLEIRGSRATDDWTLVPFSRNQFRVSSMSSVAPSTKRA